ncbi:unnamed protein product, partial [Ixodes hexagonus]
QNSGKGSAPRREDESSEGQIREGGDVTGRKPMRARCWGESELAGERSAYALVCATKWSVNQVLALVQTGGKIRRNATERDGLPKPVNSEGSVRQRMPLLSVQGGRMRQRSGSSA